MKRKIKFRGKRMDNGQWLYGSLHVIDTCGKGYTGSAIQVQNGVSRPFSVQVDPESVGQYTGLNDKNGNEIYEGDVCEDTRGFRFVVGWDDDARFLGRGIGAQQEYIRYVGQEPAVKIIGNIYDNPELVKTT